MVRLHVVSHEICRLTAGKSLFEVSPPFLTLAGIGSIHDCYLLILDEVRVICHSVWHFVLALEEIDVKVINANILDCRCDIINHLLFNYLLITIYKNRVQSLSSHEEESACQS